MKIVNDKNVAVMNVVSGVEIAYIIAEAIISFAVQKLLENMTKTDAEEINLKTLKLIADMLHQEIEEGRQRDYESLVAASVDKFFFTKGPSKNSYCRILSLQILMLSQD